MRTKNKKMKYATESLKEILQQIEPFAYKPPKMAPERREVWRLDSETVSPAVPRRRSKTRVKIL